MTPARLSRSLIPCLAAALLGLAPALPALAQWPAPAPRPSSLEDTSATLDMLARWERQDRGVAAPSGLHDGALHGPTPNQLPGGQIITTQGLTALLRQKTLPVFVFDVLGGDTALPQAIAAVWASQPGRFDDATQQRLAQLLQQVTRGQVDAPLVFYCLGPDCWMSYNAAVRALRLGYRNVLWYRGGIEAWQRAGLSLARAAAPLQVGQAPNRPNPGPGSRPPGALPPDAFGPGTARR